MKQKLELKIPLDATINAEVDDLMNERGGLHLPDVLSALKHLFAKTPVYIPSTLEISNESNLISLDAIHKNGYNHIAFSYAINDHHQIGIWIELSESKHTLYYFDSLKSLSQDSAIIKLSDLFLEPYVEVLNGDSIYTKQSDGWSCGVHVVANLINHYNGCDKTNELTTLDVQSGVGSILQHAKLGMDLEDSIDLEKHDSNKRDLLAVLENVRQREDFCKDELDLYKPLTEFLLLLLWGNLDRHDAISSEDARLKPLSAVYSHFSQLNNSAADVEVTQLLLKIALLFDTLEREDFKIKLEQAAILILEGRKNKLKIDPLSISFIEAIKLEVAKSINLKENKKAYYVHLITMLLSDQLDTFFAEVNCNTFAALKAHQEYHLAENNHYYCYTLLTSLINDFFKLTNNKANTHTLSVSEKIQQETEIKLEAEICNRLSKLGFNDTNSRLHLLLQCRPFSFMFLKEHGTPDYFKGCDFEEVYHFFEQLENRHYRMEEAVLISPRKKKEIVDQLTPVMKESKTKLPFFLNDNGLEKCDFNSRYSPK